MVVSESAATLSPRGTRLLPGPKHSQAFHHQRRRLGHDTINTLFVPEGDERPKHVRDEKPEYHGNGDVPRFVPRRQVNVQQHLLRMGRVELPDV